MSDKRAILARHEFFRGIPDAVLDRIVSRARPASYRAGQRIFARGDEGRGLLAVVSGYVRITVNSPARVNDLVLNLIGPNEVFGEIALLDGEPRTADATAASACEVLLLERRDFLPILAEEPALATRLLAVLSRRLRRTSLQLQETSFAGAEERLAKALLSLAANSSREKPRVLATQREIGQMVGLSRESTNRYLRAWHRSGLVVLEPGACTLADRTALEALAAGPEAED